jgi:cytosine/adenosine deaminase-related metal-dependent hydrolase
MTPEPVDIIIEQGAVVTMDPQHRIIRDGAVAIRADRIVAVDTTQNIRGRYQAARTIDARHKVVMPGLIDTYGHAGHGLIKAIHHPRRGWPTNQLYFHAASPDWWYAEGLLAGLERLRFGVTCGFSVIGATPARVDSPVYAARQAQAIEEIGTRAVLGVGPPDPFIAHLPEPWSGTHWEGDRAETRSFTYAEALSNSEAVIERWHGAADGRLEVALHVPYLFGRQAQHPRIPFVYDDSHVPVMIEKAEEARALADRHGVLLHTHVFRGSIAFGQEKFGPERMTQLLRTPLVLAHANGLAAPEIEAIGAAGVAIAVVPFTHENVVYGPCPVIELLQAGANVTISTDGTAPYSSYDLFKEIPRALNMQWMRFGDQALLPAGKALHMVTIDAARALGLDDRIGSLEAGKQADIILIDLNQPHLVPDVHLPRLLALYATGHDVDTVLVAGKILLEGRQAPHLDEAAIIERAREEAALAFRRLDVTPYLETDDHFWTGWHYTPENFTPEQSARSTA